MDARELITEHLEVWTGAVTHKSGAGRGNNGEPELTGIKKLRELILELAVRGKLVEQDPDDEPASVLLERIAEERERQVREGKIKKPRKIPKIKDSEKLFDLPLGWNWARLSDVLRVINGRAYKKHEMLKHGTPLLRVGNLFTSNEWYYSDLELEDDKYIDNGDLIYAWSASFGPFVWKGGRAIYHYHIWKLELYDESHLEKLFLFNYLKAVTEEIKSSGSGIAMIHMTKAKMEELVVPVPPLPEQHRIVEKVDELMALCDRLEHQVGDQLEAHEVLVDTLLDALTRSTDAKETAEHWARIAEQFDTLFTAEASIEKLKQTILQLGVMGRLVPQSPTDEPASVLLERIAEERERLVREGKIRKSKEASQVSQEHEPFDIPSSWQWCRFPDIGEVARGKSKHRPRNDPVLYKEGTVPFVQTGDVARSGKVIKSYSALYNDFGVEQSKKWSSGTLCITIAANIADTGVLGFDACFPDSIVGFTPLTEEIESEYLEYFLRTAKKNLEEYAPSTAQKNINLEVLEEILVPLPPANEQRKIVERVDELIAICDQLKAFLNEAAETRAQLAEAVVEQAVS